MAQHLVEVYNARIHLQTLPLFSLNGLQARLKKAPQFRLWSFIALTLHFGRHPFHEDEVSEAITSCTRAADEVVMKLAFESTPRLEVSQPLCLLSLVDVIDSFMPLACLHQLSRSNTMKPVDHLGLG
jgi:hypothetical protein